MSKVALINITKAFRSNEVEMQAPVGLMYLSAALKESGFETIVEDLLSHEIDDSVERVVKQNPLFIGLTTTFGVFLPQVIEYSKKVKRLNPKMTIVWGGCNASIAPEMCLKEEYVDFVCIGEGERTIRELALSLASDRTVHGIESLGYRKNGIAVVNPLRPLEKNLDEFRMDWDCIPVEKYVSIYNGEKVFKAYQSSRGCPYDCTFCYNNAFNRRRFRSHSIEYVIADMQMLKSTYGVQRIQFLDDHFFGHKARAIQLLDELYKLGIKVNNLDVRATDIDDALMAKLVKYECDMIFFGFESENERVLKAMNKQITRADIENAFLISDKYPIKVGAQVILGIPSHTREEIVSTVRYCIETIHKFPNILLAMVPYTPLPGTAMEKEAIRLGYVPPSTIAEHERFGSTTNGSFNTGISWLPWATKQDIKILQWIYPLSSYFNLARPRRYDKWFLRGFKAFFYPVARWRMYSLNFNFLLDFHAFMFVVNTYLKTKELLKIFRISQRHTGP